jgi:hypothetical protein
VFGSLGYVRHTTYAQSLPWNPARLPRAPAPTQVVGPHWEGRLQPCLSRTRCLHHARARHPVSRAGHGLHHASCVSGDVPTARVHGAGAHTEQFG